MNEVKTGEQVCNNCGVIYSVRKDDEPMNPLCLTCAWKTSNRLAAEGAFFSISCAMNDRLKGNGLMARMSDERFMKYITRQVQNFNDSIGRMK